MEEEHKSAAETVTRVDKKHTRVSYPWKALVFVMGNAMGQRCVRVEQARSSLAPSADLAH